MTSLKELGLMMIEIENGRVLQRDNRNGWVDFNFTSDLIDLGGHYRLKPKVTYYRVYNSKGVINTAVSDGPFAEWDPDGNNTHIHDFEKES